VILQGGLCRYDTCQKGKESNEVALGVLVRLCGKLRLWHGSKKGGTRAQSRIRTERAVASCF
jgi:hypothetical protein